MTPLPARALLLVALGGAVGCALRYGATLALARGGGGAWPWATLAVNLAGSLAIGMLLASDALAPEWRLLFATGLLGGFTTMSAFAHETLLLMEGGRVLRAAAYVAASAGGSVLMAWAGRALVRLAV